MDPQNLQLATRCEQRSQDSDSSNQRRESLIREWIVRFALNAGIALDASAQANYRTLWLEGFSDLAPDRLRAAFVACLRSQQFPKMPTVADVRQHLTKVEERVTDLEAEQKWQVVLAYAQSTSPDYAGRSMRIKEQTRAAINAAGGLNWIRDCPADELQWAKKRFLESYRQWAALDKNKFLLPDGEIKNLLAEVAQMKALPR